MTLGELLALDAERHRGALAAGHDQPVEPLEVVGHAHDARASAELLERLRVGLESALQGENSNEGSTHRSDPGKPGPSRTTLGTCAGLIMLDRSHLGLLDVSVRRNAFGRQIGSFEADLDFEGEPLHAVFIRAPWVEEHGDEVEVLAEVDGHPVAVRQGNVLAVAFHPELTDERRLHRWLLDHAGVAA